MFEPPKGVLKVPEWVFVVLIISVVIAVPLLVIWAINTLFALTIPYTWETWFAIMVLLGVTNRTGFKSS